MPRLPINSSTTPFQAISPASVTTNDGMPTLVNRMPWKAPIAAPAPSAATIATTVGTSLPSGISSIVTITPATPET